MTLVGERIGKIRIVEQLGEGGMGEVYIGLDETLERKVAVKAILGEQRLDLEAKARFMREAKILSQLEHPNICRIYDFVEGESSDFLIMELIRGADLTAGHREFSHGEKLSIAQQIAEVLSVAHEQNIVHRDLKPDNVMLTEKGIVKVLDFGLARGFEENQAQADRDQAGEPTEIKEDLIVDFGGGKTKAFKAPVKLAGGGYRTQHGGIVGTPMFMSPEQARGEAISGPSDMYSFGLLLQWLFTGKSPYSKVSTTTGLIIKAMRADTLPIEGVDPDLTALINRLKSVNPEKRPTALDTRDRIRWIRGKPKRRVKKLATLAFVAIMVLGTTLSSFGFYRVTQEKRRADQEADHAKQTVRLLEEFLTSVDPGKKGRNLKVFDLLEAFESRLTELEGKPEIQASLYHIYSKTYFGLGLYDEAHSFAETSREIRKNCLGEEHPDTLSSQSNFGVILMRTGKYPEAEQLIRANIETQRRILGHEHSETLRSQSLLASSLKHQGQYDEAEQLFRESLDTQTRVLGNEHKHTINTMHNLAGLLSERGENAEAEQLHRQCLEIRRRLFGDAHPKTLASRSSLANTLHRQKKHEEAEALVRQDLEVRKRVFGEDHPEILKGLIHLANALHYQGKNDCAEPIYRQSLELCTRLMGDNHPETLGIMTNLGNALFSQKRHVEAESIYRQSLEGIQEVLGQSHPQTMMVMSNLATTIQLQERYAEAEELYRRILKIRKKTRGKTHPKTINTMDRIVHVLTRQEKGAELEDFYREYLALARQEFDEADPTTLDCLNGLAWTLRQQNRNLEEAEKMARECIQIILERLGEEHEFIPEVADNLAHILEKREKQEEAIEWFRRAARGGIKTSQDALQRLGKDW